MVSSRRLVELISIGVLCIGLTACAGRTFSDFIPTAAAGAGAAAGASIGGPAGAAIGAIAAGAGTEVAIPPRQRALSADPEVAKKQIEAEEKKFWIEAFERLGIWAMIIFALVFWILPDPMHIIDKFKRRK